MPDQPTNPAGWFLVTLALTLREVDRQKAAEHMGFGSDFLAMLQRRVEVMGAVHEELGLSAAQHREVVQMFEALRVYHSTLPSPFLRPVD